jgi:hypothetical protein
MSFGDPNVPVGGNILAHKVNHRIKLTKAGRIALTNPTNPYHIKLVKVRDWNF